MTSSAFSDSSFRAAKKRKARKRVSTGTNVNRDAQFHRIAQLREEDETVGNPIISIDTKKKESLGLLYRDGTLYTQQMVKVYNHDFSHLTAGVAIPYTIYDLQRNTACMSIGTSQDTADFVCDSIKSWWLTQGRADSPLAPSILALTDSGGSNSYRPDVFKEALQRLAGELGIEIRMAPYPPYASNWNPGEHRGFPFITRALKGPFSPVMSRSETSSNAQKLRQG